MEISSKENGFTLNGKALREAIKEANRMLKEDKIDEDTEQEIIEDDADGGYFDED